MMSTRFHGESAYIRQKLETLFKQEDALYKAGARNFLFIDVPPIQLSPAGVSLIRNWRLDTVTHFANCRWKEPQSRTGREVHAVEHSSITICCCVRRRA